MKEQNNYTVKKIAEIVEGESFFFGDKEWIIKYLLIDSRKIIHAENSIFFAIKGERHDGHNFIISLIQKGVRNFVVSDLPADLEAFAGCNFIRVDNSLAALQQLTRHHREQFEIPVIGITGSNGKTIVKEWLYQLLREDKNIARSPKSYNSQVGVPISVWQLKPEHDLAIFEAGISMPGEMNILEEIIKPSIGIFTNVGHAHDENFTDTKQKIVEKLKLFKRSDLIIFCKDYSLLSTAINEDEDLKGKRLFTWSKRSNADLLIGKIEQAQHETDIQGIYKNDFLKIKIPFTDDASIENAIHCWALMLSQDYDNEIINKRMALLSPVAMRLELKEGINNCSIINDTYNSDLGSLSIALDFLNQQKQHEKKTLILSDILQSGKNEEKLYQEVSDMVKKKGIQKFIGIGEALSRQQNLFDVEKCFYNSTTDFLEQYSPAMFKDETILVKGARTFGFEQISKVMQQKAHETVMEINLNALVHNLNYYKSKLKPGTKIMAMVKAFSYGSGSFEIANILQFHHVDYLAVAYADEGVELRKAGITIPIMVMNPEEQSFEAMLVHKLEPEIYNFRTLNLFAEAVKKTVSSDSPVPVHIKLDTGMHRLGFEKGDINEMIVRIKNNKSLQIKSVFSHLVASDEAEHDEFTEKQFQDFISLSDKIIYHFNYPILRHILNSAGITRFPNAQLDMVRLGIGMYGISSNDFEKTQLQNVSTLKTTISQIKHVKAGETIGYSRKGVLSRSSRIATVPIGYADGLSRRLGNGRGKMFVNGYPAPIVGNVCMDMTMLDVTDVSANEGDEVIVFGDHYPISELAKDMDTIPYEVLTSVSRRVKRVYYHD